MNKSLVSYAMILSLCTGVACPVLADADDTYMDWSYASGLEPKQRPQEVQGLPTKTAADDNTLTDDALAESEMDLSFDIDFGSETSSNTTTQIETTSWNAQNTPDYYSNTSYTFTGNTDTLAQNNVSGDLGQNLIGGSPYNYVTKNGLSDGTQSVQIGASQYQQVPMNTIQTPAQIQTVNKQVKIQYPVTKQYPISVQYPVTIQKEITVRRPMVVQQPIVVQRPIVMHQPVTVQQQPLMVQQQPTIVQKQPIVVTTPVTAPVKPATCSNVPTLATSPAVFAPCPQKKIHSETPAQIPTPTIVPSVPVTPIQPCPMKKAPLPSMQPMVPNSLPMMPTPVPSPAPIMTSTPVSTGCAGNCVFSGTFTGSFQPVGSSK